ncbi:hypothetical protein QYE76_055113 [Lolium multiflorum]|uniref:Arabidopsis retrotransposon Orf1 C-terminal domain-containing protein n=1 Tax=Lolium multiflorum TaxID=4521 RepID=A0AAD8WLM3_LOLMU|nr:hypothetical protein QYE76_055113 [Lolium multiflorum]
MRRLRRAAASARPRRRAAVWKEGALLGAIWAVVRAQGWPEQGQRTASRLGRRSRGGARVSHRPDFCLKFGTFALGLLDDFLYLINNVGLSTYMEDERSQYYMLTKIFVESFKFNNTHFTPSVTFRIYDNPITMKLKDFCIALDIAPVGTAKKIEKSPKALTELYREVTNDDSRTIQRGKIRNIQLPAIRYFAYYLAIRILGREDTSNISSYHLAFLVAALTGNTPYHLGALIARRLSTRGPIYGGIIASRILAHLDLPLDPTDEKLTPIRLDIAAMKSHQFVTTDSSLENIVYKMLFIDGDERKSLAADRFVQCSQETVVALQGGGG